jgi:uncharacterized membrane protein
LRAIEQPLLSGLWASAIGLIVKIALGDMLAPIPLLLLGLVLGGYAWILLIVMGQKNLYVDLLMQVFCGARSDGNGDCMAGEPRGDCVKPA